MLHGYAAVFDSPSHDLGGFVERIAPGAFGRSIRAAGSDVYAFWNHDDGRVLGRQASGTLRLREDERGLAFELDLPDTTDGRDLLELVSRRDLDGMSFAFRVRPNGDRWTAGVGGAPDQRTLLDVDLSDVSPVTYPAYPDTAMALRSREAARVGWCHQQAHLRMRLRLARRRALV
jgi:HK97 family phage prohead protease